MPQCQFPIFCCLCVSWKLHRKYSQNWTKQKPKFLFFSIRDEVQSRDGGGPAGRCTIEWRGLPLAHATRWCGHLAHLLTPPFRLYILLNKKTLRARSIFQKTYCKPPPSSTRDRQGPEALPDILLDRGITTRGLLHHHACLRSDVWYGSIAVARWMSSPPCASYLDLVSCLSWSSLCNSTCYVCWDPMNIEYFVKLIYWFIISMLFMILHALRC
jgi:hypothetical protein